MQHAAPIIPVIQRVFILPVLAIVVAAGANAFSPSGIAWTGTPYETVAQTATLEGLKLIELNDLRRQIDSGIPLVLLDARPAEEFGQGHLPGAMSLPVHEIELAYPGIEILLPRDEEEGRIVVYCSGGDCDAAVNLGKFLRGQDFGNVYLFEGGMTLWRQHQLPEETGSW